MNKRSAKHWMVVQYDLKSFWASSPAHPALKYWVYQIEEEPKDKSWYALIFMQFSQCVKGSTIKRMVGGNEPVVQIAYNIFDVRAYCMKKENRVVEPIENGIFNSTRVQGHRTDLDGTVAQPSKISELISKSVRVIPNVNSENKEEYIFNFGGKNTFNVRIKINNGTVV